MIFITSNQVAYNNLLENKRHNVATEAENYRHNVATEDLGNRTLIETTRHNVATEGLQAEQIRSNYLVGMAQAEATRYSAQMHYAASVYTADSARKTANEVARVNLAGTALTNATSRLNTSKTNATNLTRTYVSENAQNARTSTTLKANLMNTLITTAGGIAGNAAKIAAML